MDSKRAIQLELGEQAAVSPRPEKVAPIGLAEALDRYIVAMNGIKSPATIVWYRSMLQPLVGYLGDVPVEAVTLDDLRQWRGTLAGRTARYVGHPLMKEKAGGLAVSSLHGHVRACRTFFAWLVEDGKLEANPAHRLELPPKAKRVRKGISDQARLKIVQAVDCPECRNRARDLAMIAFLDDSTCRAAGVVGLALDELDVGGRCAWVHEKGLGGNRKERKVFFSPETGKLLERWLAERPDCECERVFVSARGEPLAVKGLYEVLRRAAKRAGVKIGWNPHNWRHGTIRRMKKKRINLGVISELAGHSTVQLTGDLYGTLDESELQAALDGVMWEAPGE